ncbi:poly A polymerase C-terminal region-like protein [Coemansia reversa NRRL 1564]|uniref:Poly A polymerase C-terminal region-like protein n=1 Tax=Coemansia reversa (strain ATCC 12441 / NRRL 1564) TaxID=763665 RepID=A0A2G5BA71_COERN|nr:poly A polymerase C-terminal region-like protein [Coemansia reversa NRRL 1564]|eukprot:PIA15916.1 poly A polymerase C-terminal region-like protein [Coemansia reversa NRRL 1564]
MDVAVDHMSGFELAQQVNAYLEEHGQAVHTIAKIGQNPERSKHLETATTSVLGQAIDFVNLRTETYSNTSRVPQMAFGTATEDAQRRDITINALFYNIHTRTVEDFTGRGLADLRAGVVRTPLEPVQTFADDPLRVLRVVRFASRFDFCIDEDTAAAMRLPQIHTALDAKISRERIGVELDKMAAGARPLLAIRLLLRLGLYSVVFRGPSHAPTPTEPSECAADVTRAVLDLLDARDATGELIARLPKASTVTAPATRRALMLAAYAFPYHGATVADGRRTTAVAAVVIRDGLKLSGHDTETTAALHALAPRLAAAAEACATGNTGRRMLGLLVRDAGARWAAATVFAAAVDIYHGVQPVVAAAKYAALAAAIDVHGLAEAYALKPLIDGRVAARILGIRPGPRIRDVLEQVMSWQLDRPNATPAQCEEFIRRDIAPGLRAE